MQKQDNSGKAGSSLYTNQSANYGLLLTNILLGNILAMEVYHPNVVDRQLGCAALLHEMGGIGGGHVT